jgi:hypothetical protein
MPVFDGDTINLLMVRTCQPAFSASLIASVESHVADQDEKNGMCRVTPTPEVPTDWIRMWSVSLGNGYRWGKHEALAAWLANSRLFGAKAMVLGVTDDDPQAQAVLRRYRASVGPAAAKLPELVAAIGAPLSSPSRPGTAGTPGARSRPSADNRAWSGIS